MTRIAIIGGMRCGKSTLASRLVKESGVDLFSTGKRALLATDNFRDTPWDELPSVVIERLRSLDSWILEGCQAARVLRRWYREAPDEVKLDRAYYLNRSWVQRRPAQEAAAKGLAKVWRDVFPELHRRGVPIVYGVDEDPTLPRENNPPGAGAHRRRTA
jgi:adenylate kinase family enzyme